MRRSERMCSRRDVGVAAAVVMMVSLMCTANMVEAAVTLPPPNRLVWHFYKLHTSCPNAEAFIRYQVHKFWNKDKSITPKLLRLLYSDCFVTGCDASILVDGPKSEKTAAQNWGVGGFALIDKIKSVVEKRCPGVVSCADILNLATRDAVSFAGAPSYPVFTGRRDGMSSSAQSVDLPSPSISWEAALQYFQSRGLDVLDLATLLGAHTMGRTRCRYTVDRLYNYNNTGKPDTSMKAPFLTQMRKLCPRRMRKGQSDPLVFLNPGSDFNYRFTDSYYSNVLSQKAVLGVDQQLLYNNDTVQITHEFADGLEDFRKSFALSMSRMGSIKVLTGQQGEIRRNCRVINK